MPARIAILPPHISSLRVWTCAGDNRMQVFQTAPGRTGNLKIGRVVEHSLLFLAYTTRLTDLSVSKLLITENIFSQYNIEISRTWLILHL